MRVTSLIRRIHTAARTTSKALAYRARSGKVAGDVENGRLIRISNYLTALGLDEEFIACYGSPFGRHAAKAHRTAGRGEPLRVWHCNSLGRHLLVTTYVEAA